MTASRSLVVYVDVDDTLVRSSGHARIPMPSVIRHVRELAESGAELYCWSTGGADYARESARSLGIESCFVAFLPKPQVMLDDQAVPEWRCYLHVHPRACEGKTVEDYRAALGIRRGSE